MVTKYCWFLQSQAERDKAGLQDLKFSSYCKHLLTAVIIFKMAEQPKLAQFSALRVNLTLFIVNVIGAIIYVVAASPSWAIPQERELGVHSPAGEPFIWALSVFPILAVFALLNLAWGAYICFKKRWRSGYFWLMTLAVWLIAVWIDFAHH
jgi:hypothetical protein